MTRARFGGGVADFVISTSAGGNLKLSSANLTMWSAEIGGTRYTDLVRAGSAVDTIVVGSDGQVPTFDGPDGVYEMWADAGGARVLLGATADSVQDAATRAETAAAAAAAVGTTNDGVIAGRISSPGSATDTALKASIAQVKAWARNPDLLIAGAVTRDANGAATSAPVVWPDGTPGTYTADTVSTAFPGAVDAYHITYGAPVTKTYTQPAITRDASGAATTVPAIVVS